MPDSHEVVLSPAHLAARDRRRRMIYNFDTGWGGVPDLDGSDVNAWMEMWFTRFTGDEDSQLDSVWWCWSEGGWAPYPSKVLPVYDGYRKWLDSGIDPVRITLDESKRRGLEAFFSYRINSENDFVGLGQAALLTPMKQAHPEWLIPSPWPQIPVYNFEYPGVRDYKLSVLREAVQNYDFDGFEIDWRGGPWSLPQGHRWERRHFLTEFTRSVRLMMLDEERKQPRPILLAARVSDCPEGCHLDGFDIETWAREGLIDILVVGGRAIEVDIAGFRSATAGTGMKIYPYNDGCHAPNGYLAPPIEFLRGQFANWWNQGPDGVCTFNATFAAWGDTPPPWLPDNYEQVYLQAWRELGSPDTLRLKDKAFVVGRRFGEMGDDMVRLGMYFNSNRFAPLPARLTNDGALDTIIPLTVGDDLKRDADQVKELTLRVMLSDPSAKELPAEARIAPSDNLLLDVQRVRAWQRAPHPPAGQSASFEAWDTYNHEFITLPAKGIENCLEVALNGVILDRGRMENEWLVFDVGPAQLAHGKNLVGLRVIRRDQAVKEEISVEKVELHVRYRANRSAPGGSSA